MDNSKTLTCHDHKKPVEFLCNQCNSLLCSKCNNIHLRKNQNHICDHIDDIRNSLEKLNLNNNNNKDSHISNSNSSDSISNSFIFSQFNTDKEKIWNDIKCSTEEIDYLHLKEKEISDIFKSLHEYLDIEELKLKKPIFEDIDSVKEIIGRSIVHLKSIFNIININNNKKNEDQFKSPDTTVKYSNDSIIKSFKESNSIDHFIENNKEILIQIDKSITDEYKDLFSYEIDTIVLIMLYRYNTKYRISNSENQTETDRMIYQVAVESNEIKEIISKMFQKTVYQPPQRILQPNQNMDLVVSTHLQGITLFNIDASDVLQNKLYNGNMFALKTSIVKINNQQIYIFTSDFQNCKIFIYGIKDDSLELESEDTVPDFLFRSASYDGKDHIYFLENGDTSPHTFRRYNIKTKLCESLNVQINFPISSSFFYKGQLYYISYITPGVYIFDIDKNKTTLFFDKLQISKALASCHDGNGNIYFKTNDSFMVFNIHSKNIQFLDSIYIKSDLHFSMVYHKNRNDPMIIFFGGSEFKNYRYNIADNSWSKYYVDSQYRYYCDSISLS